MIRVTGTLMTPTGIPAPATLKITSLFNSGDITRNCSSTFSLTQGKYDFELLPGAYRVRLTQPGQSATDIGIIHVAGDEGTVTLNDLLTLTETKLSASTLSSVVAAALEEGMISTNIEILGSVDDSDLTTAVYGHPDVGGLVFAALYSTSAPVRGNHYAGSDLRQVVLRSSGSGSYPYTYLPTDSSTYLPGTYRALGGYYGYTGAYYYTTLFMRVA